MQEPPKLSLLDIIGHHAEAKSMETWLTKIVEHPKAASLFKTNPKKPEFAEFYLSLCLQFLQSHGSLENTTLGIYVSLNGLPETVWQSLFSPTSGVAPNSLWRVYRSALFGLDFAVRNRNTLGIEIAIEAEMRLISQPQSQEKRALPDSELFFLHYEHSKEKGAKQPPLNDLDKLAACPCKSRLYIGRIAAQGKYWIERVKKAIASRINDDPRCLRKGDQFWIILAITGGKKSYTIGHTHEFGEEMPKFVWSY